jgi:hypothetical protein
MTWFLKFTKNVKLHFFEKWKLITRSTCYCAYFGFALVCLSRDCPRILPNSMLSDLLSQASNTKMLISVYLLGCLFYVKDKSMFFKLQEMLVK